MLEQILIKAAGKHVISGVSDYRTAVRDQRITVRNEELTEISKQLKEIRDELDRELNSAINKMKSNTFYTAGKAKKTVDQLDTINNKFLELVDHYEFASIAVTHALDTMTTQDQKIGSQIAGNLGDK